jgi:hypothetical protein
MAQQTSPDSIRSFLTWVWAGILIAGGTLFLLISTGLLPYAGPIEPVLAGGIAAISLPFWGRWLARREGWAAITAWVLFALGGLTLVLYLTPGRELLVVVALLGTLTVPLTAAYFMNHQRWWLLILAYVALALGVMLTLYTLGVKREAMAGVLVLSIALPLWVVGATSPRARWALFPAALLSGAAVIVLVFLVLLPPGSAAFFIALNVMMAAVCFGTWFVVRRLDWAMWLAVAFVGAAALSFWFPSMTNWALAALALGGYIVYRQVRGTMPATASGSQASAPAASTPVPPGKVATRPASSGSAATPASTPPPSAPAATPPPPPVVTGPPPGIEFRPLDPFKDRKRDED